MNYHVEVNNIIPKEQKGGTNNTYGTIDQLIINKMVLHDAHKRKRNLSTAWIDYKKAFDSVPYDWLIETLRIHKFDDVTINFFETTMKHWRTSLILRHENGEIRTDTFDITNGIFQGDSPSGLHFVLCLLPLSWLLRKAELGYRLKRTRNLDDVISHLLFMDDLKIYAENDTNLTSLINIVKTFSDDIRMSFGLNKCNKLTIVKGEVVQRENIVLNNGDELQSLDNNAHYKYLGFNERETTDKRSKSLIQNDTLQESNES